MFKYIISILLLLNLFIAPAALSAEIGNVKINQANTNQHFDKTAVIQKSGAIISKNDLRFIESAKPDNIANKQNQPLSSNLWLISLALLGFVMLSNRSGV